jgi:hypothetical protein
MFTHTTVKGLQAEKIRQATRPSGHKSDQDLTLVTVSWRKIGTAIAVTVAAVAIVAANVGQATPVENSDPTPFVIVETDGADTGVPAGSSTDEESGGSSFGILKAE